MSASDCVIHVDLEASGALTVFVDSLSDAVGSFLLTEGAFDVKRLFYPGIVTN